MKYVIAVLLALMLTVSGILLAPTTQEVVVCHATGSAGNPYVRITVSLHSVDDATGLNGHGNHGDDIWAAFEYLGVQYPGQGDASGLDGNCNVIPEATSTPLPPTETNTPDPPTPTDLPPTETPTDPPPTETPEDPTDTPDPTETPTDPPPTSTPTDPPPTATPTATNPPPPKTGPALETALTKKEFLVTSLEISVPSVGIEAPVAVGSYDGDWIMSAFYYDATYWPEFDLVGLHSPFYDELYDVEVGDLVYFDGMPYQVYETILIDFDATWILGQADLTLITCYGDNWNQRYVVYAKSPALLGALTQ